MMPADEMARVPIEGVGSRLRGGRRQEGRQTFDRIDHAVDATAEPIGEESCRVLEGLAALPPDISHVVDVNRRDRRQAHGDHDTQRHRLPCRLHRSCVCISGRGEISGVLRRRQAGGLLAVGNVEVDLEPEDEE